MTSYTVKGIRLSISDHPEVYPPAEDTFLLLEALEVGGGKDAGRTGGPRERVLELGTGSGIIAVFCAKKGARVLATDINPHAVRLARRNARQNGVEIEVVEANLFDGIDGSFDTIIFNPPYLPTSPDDITGDRWLDASVNGGPDGLGPARLFLADLDGHLVSSGRAYLLHSSLSGEALPSGPLFTYREIASKHLEFETLVVREIIRTGENGSRMPSRGRPQGRMGEVARLHGGRVGRGQDGLRPRAPNPHTRIPMGWSDVK